MPIHDFQAYPKRIGAEPRRRGQELTRANNLLGKLIAAQATAHHMLPLETGSWSSLLGVCGTAQIFHCPPGH